MYLVKPFGGLFFALKGSRRFDLQQLVRDVLHEFSAEVVLEQGLFYTYHNVLLSFRYSQTYRSYILDLYRSGLTPVLLEELNHFHKNMEGSMSFSSIEKYQLYL